MYAFYITHARGKKRGQVTDFRIFDDYDKAIEYACGLTKDWSRPMETEDWDEPPIIPVHITDGDYEFLGHFQPIWFDTHIKVFTVQQD